MPTPLSPNPPDALARIGMADLHDVADYALASLLAGGLAPSPLKLHKILFYIQAWSLATRGAKALEGSFQAWVHGPASPELHERLKASHSLSPLSRLGPRDILSSNASSRISPSLLSLLDEVLDSYGAFCDSQLEAMARSEEPWIRARGHRRPSERCETPIDELLMASFYANQLAKPD